MNNQFNNRSYNISITQNITYSVKITPFFYTEKTNNNNNNKTVCNKAFKKYVANICFYVTDNYTSRLLVWIFVTTVYVFDFALHIVVSIKCCCICDQRQMCVIRNMK